MQPTNDNFNYFIMFIFKLLNKWCQFIHSLRYIENAPNYPTYELKFATKILGKSFAVYKY